MIFLATIYQYVATTPGFEWYRKPVFQNAFSVPGPITVFLYFGDIVDASLTGPSPDIRYTGKVSKREKLIAI